MTAPNRVQYIFGVYDPTSGKLLGLAPTGNSPYASVLGNVAIVATLAALRLQLGSVNQTIFATGKVSQADGSGGTFVLNAADTSGAWFTGTVSGTVLTVVTVNNGTLAVGQSVNRGDTGVSIGTITSFGTGGGGIGTYNLSASASIPTLITFSADDNTKTLVGIDGSRWNLATDVIPVVDAATYGNDSGVVNTYVFTHSGASLPVTLAAGSLLRFTPLTTNTGASTLNADGTGAVAIIGVTGATLVGGELSSLGPVLLQSTGTQWQILATTGLQTGDGRSSVGTDSGAANAYVVTHNNYSLPAILTTGALLRFTPLNTNTGAVTINADGTGALAAVRANGTACTGGEFSSLGPVVVQYNGAAWQIVTTAGAQPGFERTAAEVAAGVTPTNYAYLSGNVLRHGIVANSSGAATANTTTLKACWNPANGIPGQWVFPNLTGSDIYYFNGVIPIRDGVNIDLQNCTVNFGGSVGAGDVNSGLFFALRDFTLENGAITCAVNTTLAVNSGQAIVLGARGTDSSYFTVWDSLLSVPMGNVTLRNLRISMNNTGTNAANGRAILMLGGLVNGLVENIVINGNGTCAGGIYYEFGWATTPGGTAASQTSHAHNMNFRNIKVYGLKTTSITDGYGIGLTGAYNCTVDGLYVNGAYNGFEYRPGEALFFNPWASVDDVGAKRSITLRNLVCEGITSTGISLVGAEAASSGYLSGAGLTAAQQTDLMSFSIDGFAVGNGAGTGMFVSGSITARNGYLANTAGSGQLIISDECMQFEFENVRIVGSSAQGVRANFAGIGVWGTPRQKIGAFRNCIVAGNGTFGLEFGANTRSVTISHCRIGYSSLYDAAAEAVQGIGVLCDAGCNGVVCDSNYVTTFGGANAYSITGTTSGGCNLINPLGTVTTAGAWEFDGCATATSTNLALKANIINTANKYFGKRCINSSTSKLFIAQGSADVSTWVSVDGATTITPV